MTWTLTLQKNRVLLTIVATILASLMVVPAALGQSANDPFGVGYGQATGLGNNDVRDTISSIIQVALSLLGIVALVIILAGGFKWMTAGGSEDKVAEARKLIFSGIIGLAIILSAYAIAQFVLGQLSAATGSGTVQGF